MAFAGSWEKVQAEQEGLYVTLNSDDPPMFGTDLTREYRLLASQGLSALLLR